VEAVWEEEVKLQIGGRTIEVGFKPGVKERGSYRCTIGGRTIEVGFKPGVKERGSYRCTEW